MGLAVFTLILPWLDDGTVFPALDDTLARQRGLKVYGVGMHHDPLISTRKVARTNWGHSWVVLGVIMRFPFCPDKYFLSADPLSPLPQQTDGGPKGRSVSHPSGTGRRNAAPVVQSL